MRILASIAESSRGTAGFLVVLVVVAALAGGVIGAIVGVQLVKPAPEGEIYKVEAYKWKLIYALRSADLAMWNARAAQNFILLDGLLMQRNQTPTRLAILYSTKALEAIEQASTLLIETSPPEDVKTFHDNVVLKIQEMRQSIVQLIQVSNKTSYTSQDFLMAANLASSIANSYSSVVSAVELALARLKT